MIFLKLIEKVNYTIKNDEKPPKNGRFDNFVQT